MMRGRKLREWIRKRLHDLREGKHDTKTGFADRAKLSLRHVYKIESGESSPTVETLADWLYACDTDLAQFFAPLATSIEANGENAIMQDLFQRAMLVPAKRTVIVSVLKALFVDESEPGGRSR